MQVSPLAKCSCGLAIYILPLAFSLAKVAEAGGVVGTVNANTCPHGSTRITTLDACESAASDLGIDFARSLRTSSMPAGCAVQQPGQSYSTVFFNSHESGGTTSVHAPLCTTDAGSSGLVACQRSDTDALGSDCQCDSSALINECSARKFCWTDASCMASAKTGEACTGDLVASGAGAKDGVYTSVGDCNGKGEWKSANGYYIAYTDFGSYLNWAVKKTQCSTSAFGWISPSSAGQVASPDLAEGASWANQGSMSVRCVDAGSVPTPPPTPTPTPLPTPDLLGASRPKEGTVNSNTCPADTSRITREDVCMDAAGELGKTYARAITSSTSPGGCFAQDDLIFYNKDSTGGSNGVHAIVCITAGGPTPRPTPTPPTPAGVFPAPTRLPTQAPSPRPCPTSDGYYTHGGVCRFRYSAFCSAQRATSYPCLKLQEFVGQGFDFTTTGTSGSELVRAASKGRVTEMTLGAPIMPFGFGGQLWQHSINVEVVQLSGTATSETKLAQYEDVGSYQAALSAELGVYGAYGVYEAEASVKVEAAVQSALARNQVIGKQETFRPLYLIRLADFTEGTEEFVDDVRRVYDGEFSMAHFIANYGTHAIREVHVGGRLNVQVRMSSCLSTEDRQRALSSKVCASQNTPGAGVGGCADVGLDDATTKRIENSIEDWDVVVEGGDPSHCASKTACDGAAWLQSVDGHGDLQILSIKLEEITDYIPNMAHRSFIANGLKEYIGNQSKRTSGTTKPPADLCSETPSATDSPTEELSGVEPAADAGRLSLAVVISVFLSFAG